MKAYKLHFILLLFSSFKNIFGTENQKREILDNAITALLNQQDKTKEAIGSIVENLFKLEKKQKHLKSQIEKILEENPEESINIKNKKDLQRNLKEEIKKEEIEKETKEKELKLIKQKLTRLEEKKAIYS
jgi:chromosome segregation ATPase